METGEKVGYRGRIGDLIIPTDLTTELSNRSTIAINLDGTEGRQFRPRTYQDGTRAIGAVAWLTITTNQTRGDIVRTRKVKDGDYSGLPYLHCRFLRHAAGKSVRALDGFSCSTIAMLPPVLWGLSGIVLWALTYTGRVSSATVLST